MSLRDEIQKRIAQQRQAEIDHQAQLASLDQQVQQETARRQAEEDTKRQEWLVEQHRLEERLKQLGVAERLEEFRREVWKGKGRLVWITRNPPSTFNNLLKEYYEPEAHIALVYDYQTVATRVIREADPPVNRRVVGYPYDYKDEPKRNKGTYRKILYTDQLELSVRLGEQKDITLILGSPNNTYGSNIGGIRFSADIGGIYRDNVKPQNFNNELIELAANSITHPNAYPTPESVEQVGQEKIRRELPFWRR